MSFENELLTNFHVHKFLSRILLPIDTKLRCRLNENWKFSKRFHFLDWTAVCRFSTFHGDFLLAHTHTYSTCRVARTCLRFAVRVSRWRNWNFCRQSCGVDRGYIAHIIRHRWTVSSEHPFLLSCYRVVSDFTIGITWNRFSFVLFFLFATRNVSPVSSHIEWPAWCCVPFGFKYFFFFRCTSSSRIRPSTARTPCMKKTVKTTTISIWNVIRSDDSIVCGILI